MKEASPRPWRWDGEDIEDAQGLIIADRLSPENAELLTRAVNAHDALVAALKAVEWGDSDNRGNSFCPLCSACNHEPAKNRYYTHDDGCELAAALRLAGEL